VGSTEIELAALRELERHDDMLPITRAYKNNDKVGVREAAGAAINLPGVHLDMELLHTPKYQALMALIVLQVHRVRFENRIYDRPYESLGRLRFGL